MQPPIPFSCDGKSSWVCIGVFRPRRLTTAGHRSEDLVDRITSISTSFKRFAKTAVLSSTSSKHVAIISVWERSVFDLADPFTEEKSSLRRLLSGVHSSVSKWSTSKAYPYPVQFSIVDTYEKALSHSCHMIHMSWYEASSWEFKELQTLETSPKGDNATSSPEVGRFLKSISSPLILSESSPVSNERAVSSDTTDLSSQLSCAYPAATHQGEDSPSFPSFNLLARPSSSPFLPQKMPTCPSLCLSLGDTVHLRSVTSRKEHLWDALSYSCLAILKAYFSQTEGLLSYVFYRSLDGSRMVGLGVWQGVDRALAYLDAPDGSWEEKYWRSMGAKTSHEIYRVAALVD